MSTNLVLAKNYDVNEAMDEITCRSSGVGDSYAYMERFLIENGNESGLHELLRHLDTWAA